MPRRTLLVSEISETGHEYEYPIVNAVEMPGDEAGEKIENAIALLSSGGIVDARGFTGTQTISSDMFSGVTDPILILMGAATLTISATQNIPSQCWISGQPDATILTSSISDSPIINFNSATNAGMRNLIVVGPGTTKGGASPGGSNIQVLSSVSVLIENVELRNYSMWGIIARGTTGSTFRNIKSTIQTTMAGATDAWNTADIIIGDDSYDNIVENCYLTGSSDWGICFAQIFNNALNSRRNKATGNTIQNKYLGGILNYSTVHGNTGYNTITNNHIRTIYGRVMTSGAPINGMGIYCANSTNDVIDGNIVEDAVKTATNLTNQVGAISHSGAGATITNNRIDTSGYDGISVLGDSLTAYHGFTVNGNSSENCLRNGFLFQDIVGLTANGNRAHACGSVGGIGGDGIFTTTVTAGQLNGNTADTGNNYGIRLLNCLNTVGSGNISHSNKTNGIYVAGGTNIALDSNIVYNNSIGSAGTYSGIEADTTTRLNILNTIAFDSQGTPTQKYGVAVQSSVTGLVYAGTNGSGNVTALEDISATSLFRFNGAIAATLATTTTGLAAGTFWDDGGTVKVV